MDTESFEQIEISRDMIGDKAAFMQDGMMVTVQSHDDEPLGVSLPETVILTIEETEAVVKGQTAASSYKPAILENGLRVMVPPHIGNRHADRGQHRRRDLSRTREGLSSPCHANPP